MAMHAEGGGVAELDLAEQKWVRVDTAESGDVARAVAWMQRGRQRADFEVSLVSAADHIDMRRSYVKRPQKEEVSERLPDADASRLRTELEGVGRGVGEFTQLRERYLQLAANAKTENRVLFGFSDGALSEDGRVGAYSWLVAVKKGDTKLEVLAGGGGGADANEKTNVLLSSTRMENLGLAAGMSYARDWMGRVEWRADNLGTVKGFGKVKRMTPNDWCRVSDRDVAGYLQLMREKVAGNWRVRHVRAHAEKRASRAEWSLDELGNDAADGVAGRVRDGLVRDLRRYEVQTAEWQRQVDARGGGEEAEVEQPDWVQLETVPAWDLPTKRNWMLMHDKQVVVGPIAAWVRETLQNGYSTRYLSAQTAGLYVERGEEKEVRVGCELELDGERWEVRSVEGGEVRCVAKATEQRADEDDEVLDLTGTAGVSDGSGSEDMRVAVRDADEELVLPLSDARVLVCTETPMAEAETALGAPEVGARIEVYWTGMRAWYPGRVLPLQEEDEEGSMRVAYDDGAELLHPLTERWRAEGASDSEEGAEAEQGLAGTEAESDSEDDSEHYLPGPDVRLVRNVWVC